MNADSVPSVLLIAVLVLCSSYFSATETAFTCLNRTRMKTLAEKGNKRAETALALAEQYDRLLTTILIGNNLVNITMSTVSTLLFIRLLPDIGATVSTIVITVIVLIFGEISPKTIAKETPEKFAMFATPLMRILVTVLTPISFLFSMWQRLITRLFKVNANRGMTQDELLTLVDEVESEGSIDAEESDLLRSAISFTDQQAQDILTPRVDLECVSIHTPKEEIARIFSESQYSRLPVYEGSTDNIVGILYQKDFYSGSGISPASVSELMREAVYVPQSVPIDDLFRVLQRHKSHIAVVSDEFGGIMGIVTMEDILEELVGEIWDEHDEAVESFRKISEDTYRVLCSTDLDRMERFFDLELDSDSATISGWVMEQTGCIPSEGDTFRYENLFITVTATDSHRVVEIELRRDADEDEP